MKGLRVVLILAAGVAAAGCCSAQVAPYKDAAMEMGKMGPGVSAIAHRAPNLTPEEDLLLRAFDSLIETCQELGKGE